ncbi:Wzz/FepE/Etk N-terminal domain-containing protein [Novosphingobium sp. RD2P27]|uniref:non-specific protein-tyrosine kinase n=1 Tax=Novosphingobium kalidii TaxID=3230299 RepID=A0ABV2D0K1_9SPHN
MEIVHTSDAQDGRFSDLVAMVTDTLRRRWLTMAIVSAVIFALGVAGVLMLTPQYSATAQIRIDPSQNPLSRNTQQETQQSLSAEAIETEVAVLSSLDLARAVVRRLRLTSDPEFTEVIDRSAEAATMSTADRETAIARELLQNLSVGREKLSYILGVTFRSEDPEKAALIANAFAETYLSTKTGSRVGTAERQVEWFNQRLAALGEEVRAADAALAQYRARAGLTQSGGAAGTTIVDQQVGPLSSQLATAESEAAAARASLNAARNQIARGGIDSVSEVRMSNVIADLRRQRADILRNMGEVQARYGERHPESVRVRDQLAAVDQQIEDEARRVIGSLEANATAADARAASLRGSMNRLEGEQAQNTRNAVIAESLQREAEAKRAAYDRLAAASLESTQVAQDQISQAVIVSRAEPPLSPSFPNKPLFIALALVVALAAGAGTIAVQEMLVTGLRSVEDVETQLGIPVLAAIPKVGRSKNPADLLLEKPTSMYAESLRIARASILGVRTARPPQVIALTSALPSEGKTTTALSFARTLATNNARTLLLECDVRRAALRPLVSNAMDKPGIVEVLHGEASVAEAIQSGDVPGLDHMLVREQYFSSGDLFGGGAMEKVLAELRSQYDLIVLDLPPLVGLADGRFLAVLADVTALIIKWDATPAQAAASALGWLKADGANPVGAIYTMVDSSAEAIGGLYYSKKYSGYYTQAA